MNKRGGTRRQFKVFSHFFSFESMANFFYITTSATLQLVAKPISFYTKNIHQHVTKLTLSTFTQLNTNNHRNNSTVYFCYKMRKKEYFS